MTAKINELGEMLWEIFIAPYADMGLPFHWITKHSKWIALFLSPFSSLKGSGTVCMFV